jgi:hypothetical protein
MKRKPNRRRLRAESLEDRQMMAGDVTATQNGQSLTLTGGVDDNGIVITGLAGQIQVTGLEQGGSTTTVNSNHRATFTDIRQIVIDLDDGDDVLVITNANLAGSVSGRARVGTPGIPISGLTAGNGAINTISVQMGDGDDIIGLGQFDNKTDFFDPFTQEYLPLVDDAVDPLLKPLTLSRNLTIDMGDDDNILRASAVTIGGSLSITQGIGDDELWLESRGTIPGVRVSVDTSISAGEGDDEVRLRQFSARNLNLSTLGGADDVKLLTVSVTQNAIVASGDDYDNIVLDALSARQLKTDAGEGDDDVFVTGARVTSKATINGGAGDNIFYELGGNQIRSLVLLNFETIVGSSVKSKTISRAQVAV